MRRLFRILWNRNRIINVLQVISSAIELVIHHVDNERSDEVLMKVNAVIKRILRSLGVEVVEKIVSEEECIKRLEELQDEIE